MRSKSGTVKSAAKVVEAKVEETVKAAVETPTEAKKAPEAPKKPVVKKEEEKPAAKKIEEKLDVKKTEEKPEVKKTEEKPEVMKSEEKSEVKKGEAVVAATPKKAVKAVPSKAAVKKEPKVSVYIEYLGKQKDAKDILDKAKKAYSKMNKGVEIKTIELYVKPEENAAYYVVNGEGSDRYKVEI